MLHVNYKQFNTKKKEQNTGSNSWKRKCQKIFEKFFLFIYSLRSTNRASYEVSFSY